MIKGNLLKSMVILFLLLPVAFLGCGGGDDAAAPVPSPSIQVRPLGSYDFGTVTPKNVPAPLEVEITNSGTAGLNVSSIALLKINPFYLYLNRGSNPCGTAFPTIAPGNSCNAEIEFDSQLNGSFGTTLSIISDATNASTVDVALLGAQDLISELNVRINQIEGCPRPGVVTAYVSVTDQGGYPVTGLSKINFDVFEGGNPKGQPMSAGPVSNSISVSLVMDYSGSIIDIKDAVDDMEQSVAGFVDELGAGDEAEIIKFADDWDVEQPFTSDISELKVAIFAPYDNSRGTDLYDAVMKAVDDVALLGSKDRRAVIVVTDGKDNMPGSALADVINDAKAKGVPIFAVGLGDIDLGVLEDMADKTGGQVYKSPTTDNLRTIYQQLADLLFEDQYILTYNSVLEPDDTPELKINANSGGLTGNEKNTKQFTPCP